MPRVKSTSFTDTGTPCSRPSGSPFITAISASRGRRRATSCATRAKALRRGLTASMRARTAPVSSTGDSSLRRIKAAHSTAERQTTSSAAIVTSSPPRHCIIRPVAADATRMRRDAAGRPAGEQDRHGSALSALEGSPDGRLRRARVRLPDGGWIEIEPGAGAAGPWGASDLVTRDGRPLTRLAALDWARVDRIPPLAEPARLPAGAGTAIFNLLARLAAEQGVAVLRYDAPYPTEALFLALLESFRYVPEEAPNPMDAFARGELEWAPAPHDVAIEAGGVWVQRRERGEKVVCAGRVYYRPGWQGVRRVAPRAGRRRARPVARRRARHGPRRASRGGRPRRRRPARARSGGARRRARGRASRRAGARRAAGGRRARHRRRRRGPGARSRERMTEARPDSFGARRALGGSRRATIHSGRPECWGVEARPDSFGARRALGGRGAPRFIRGATSVGGSRRGTMRAGRAARGGVWRARAAAATSSTG